MSETRSASRTALAVATLRAYHHLVDGEPYVLDDPIAARIIDPEMLAAIERRDERFAHPLGRGLRLSVLLRSRYAEDELAAAVAGGMRQFVSLGAGYDTFTYRQPAWAHELRIFEVDHPATQREKRARLERSAIALPGNLTFVPIDFETTALLDALRAGGVDASRPVFFSWLGVIPYLSESAIDATFASICTFPRGSAIVFSYANTATPQALADAAGATGEPWLTRMEPDDFERLLRPLGFSTISFLTPQDTETRYALSRLPMFDPPRFTNLGKATI